MVRMPASHRLLFLFSLLLMGIGIPPAARAAATPSAHWALDESSGSTASNAQGSGDGSLQNGPQWVTGVIGNALSFDGQDDYVTLPDSAISGLGTALTLTLWFKTDSAGGLIGYEDTAYPGDPVHRVPIAYVGLDGKVRCQFWRTAGTAPITSSQTVNDNEWHLLGLVGNGSTQSLYLDGQLVGSLSGTITHLDMTRCQVGVAATNFTWMFSNQDWFFFEGLIDDVRLYSQALTQAEIQALIPALPPRAKDDLFGVATEGSLSQPAATGVLFNDYDPNQDALTAILVAGTAHGVLNLNSSGSFDYTPDAGFRGFDTFTYKANDTSADSNVATVTLRVGDASVGLVAHWPFDDNAGDVAQDVSGNDYHGTVHGASLVSGVIGGAFSFDGESDYVELPELLLSQTTVLTLTLWFKTTTPGVLIGQQENAYPSTDSTYYTPVLYVGQDGKLRGQVWVPGGANPITSTAAVTDGAWHHATLIANATTQSLYLDGQNLGTFNGVIDHLTQPINQVGLGNVWGWDGGQPTTDGWAFFHGYLDDVRLYNRALAPEEIPEGPDVSAEISGSTTVFSKNETVSFLAEGSDPNPGDTLAYAWDFGDGNTSALQNPDHAYTEAGFYTATVTVTDTTGYTASASVTLTVKGLIDSRDMVIDSAAYSIAYGKRFKTGNEFLDSFDWKGELNLAALLDAAVPLQDLSGTALEIQIAGAPLDLGLPTKITPRMATWQTADGVLPKGTFQFSPATGAMKFKLKNADLDNTLRPLGAANEDNLVDVYVQIPLELTLGPWSQSVLLGTSYTNRRADTVGRGTYRWGKVGDLPEGVIAVTSAKLLQRSKGGEVAQALQMVISFAPLGDDEYDPSSGTGADVTLGQFIETVGDGSVAGAEFQTADGILFRYLRPRFDLGGTPLPAAGITKMEFDKRKRQIRLRTNWLPVTDADGPFGVAPVTDAKLDVRTSVTLTIAVSVQADMGGSGDAELFRKGTTFSK